MDFKKLLNEDAQKILTEESLTAIQEAYDNQVQASVTAALEEQDEQYASKLKELVQKIDESHTTKLKKLVEALDKNNTSKLMKVVKLFKRDSGKQAEQFKMQLVESVSSYLDEYLNEVVSKEDFEKAIKNENAYKILGNLREALAVDSIMMKDSIKDAVLDGKKKLEEKSNEAEEIRKELQMIKEENEKLKIHMLLEEKTSKLSESKKRFMRKALQDKSYKFIKENFDYTLRMFEKQEKERLTTLKEEAVNKRQVKPDVVPKQKVIEEKVNNREEEHGNMYLDALSRTWEAK